MANLNLPRTILLGYLLVAFGGQSRAEVVTCVDAGGSVTYTNLPCESDADSARGLSLNGPVVIKEEALLPAKGYAISWEVREGAAVKLRVGKPKTSLDMDTLKAARSSTQTMDKASSYLQQKNLVALDLRNPGWFDFH